MLCEVVSHSLALCKQKEKSKTSGTFLFATDPLELLL